MKLSKTLIGFTILATASSTPAFAEPIAPVQQNPASTQQTVQNQNNTTQNNGANTNTQAPQYAAPQYTATQNQGTTQVPQGQVQQQAQVPATGLITCYNYYAASQGKVYYRYQQRTQCLANETATTPEQMVNNPASVAQLEANTPVSFSNLQRQAQVSQSSLADTLLSGAKTDSSAQKIGEGDDYPFKTPGCNNAPFGTYDSAISPLGGNVCQCIDFAAWRLNQALGGDKNDIKFKYRYDSSGRSDAINWPSIYSDVPQDNNPHVGDIAILNNGGHGHAAYISDVAEDGTVTAEQYNYANAQNNFTSLAFSKVKYPKSFFTTYIHFEEMPAFKAAAEKAKAAGTKQ